MCRCIVLLLNNGYETEAFSTWRTLHENECILTVLVRYGNPAIKSYLNWDNASEAILAGAGSLGSALLGYEGFEEYGLKIIAAFDADPGKIGTEIHGRSVFGVDRLAELVRRLQVRIGIICVPAAFAQEVADAMVAGGIRAIWNFANVSLKVPDEVVVQREVIAGGLAVLSVKMNRRLADLEQQDGN